MTQRDPELGRVRSSVVEAYRADGAAPADIQRAYLRFSWSRRKVPPRLLVVRWLAAGVAIGFGVASAATLIPTPKVRSAPAVASAEVTVAMPKRHPVRRAARDSAAKDEPSLVEPLPTTSEQPPAPLPPPPSIIVPSVAQQQSAAPPSAAPPSPASMGSASDWQRAAAALRGGDLSAAEAALATLERSDSLRDREAAELARAQLLVGRGLVAEATPTLQRLAREGGSAVIRSQAASMLQSLAR